MQLIQQLSHMPFVHGKDLYFCTSDGLVEKAIPQHGVPEHRRQEVVNRFQPWRLVRKRGELIEDIDLGLPATTARQVICNPVVQDNHLSFIYNTSLWSTPLDNISPVQILANVFTGFKLGSLTAWATGKGGRFFVEGEAHEVPMEAILRIVPSGDNFLITGKTGDRFHTVLYTPGYGYLNVKANGQDVYKCCFHEDKVIHAVRVGEFEERYLHIDPFQLC